MNKKEFFFSAAALMWRVFTATNENQQQLGTDVGYTLGLKLTETETNVKRNIE